MGTAFQFSFVGLTIEIFTIKEKETRKKEKKRETKVH